MTLGFDRPDLLWLLLLLLPMAGLARWSRRKIPPIRRWIAFGLRALLLVAVVFALSELTLRRPVDDLAVVFVVDRSASVGPDGEAASDAFVQEALEAAGNGDVAGMVVFGGEAMVEAEPRQGFAFHGVESRPNEHQSDLASGLRLGTALLPADRTRRLVLLSDGEQTLGDAAAQALQVADEDLEVSVVPVGLDPGPEVWLSDLIAPPRVDQDRAFDLRIVADSERPVQGQLRLYRNDQYLGSLKVDLPGGRAEVLSVRQDAAEPGLYRYRAVLELDDPAADTLPQNNAVLTTVQVSGRPSVLIVEGDGPGHAEHLAEVLRNDGLDVVVRGADGVPAGLPELRPYAAVILSDVPAFALSRRQQEALQSYVRDLGRGLVMIGGDRSFGVGGYYKTPVEAALPVNMDLEDKTRFPKLAMVLAIDKSCSMGGGAGSKIELAREAAIRTAELLSDRDMLGVIGFDGAASWISPVRELTQRQAVLDDIASLRPGGGTDIYPALVTAIDELNETDAALKHIILLSDGMTTPGEYQKLLTKANGTDKITVTSVTIGSDSDQGMMKDLATWGGGNYYLVTDAHAIPAIFTRETLLATRSFLVEEPFVPKAGTPSELTRGLTALPTLGGYVATEAKGRATVSLLVPDADGDLPLLAHWRHGLGRSVAFTSDAKGRWGAAWVGSESYTRMWTQTIRWVVGDPEASNLAVDTEIRDGALWVTVDAFDAMGGFRNFLEGEARVVAPDLQTHQLKLLQVAPGRYQATLPVDQDGSWLVGVALTEGEAVVGQAVSEAVQPYSPEFRAKGAGKALMDEIGRVGGGGTPATAAAVFARPEVVRRVPRPLWPPLLALAGFVLLADVAVRRLDLFGGAGGTATVTRPAAAPPRWAFREAIPKGPAGSPAGEVPVEPQGSGPAAPPPTEVDPESYAGRLLAARRKARDRMDDT